MKPYWVATGVEEQDLREDCLPPIEGKGSGGKRIRPLRELDEADGEANAAWRRERESTPDVVEQIGRGR